MNTPSKMSVAEFQKCAGSVLVLDVRTPAEFETMHMEGAVLRPLSDLNVDDVKTLAQGKAGCVVICGGGTRATRAAEQLIAGGFSGPLNVLEGGIRGWEAAGLPLQRGAASMSLERQVRIVAGALVVTGALLAYFVNPLWVALSGFVGAGLVFAGITDTCGMGMILARMPWNQRSGKASSCSIK